VTTATREIRCGDGVAFLRRGPLPADHALVTSLPDVSELPALGLEGWRAWFAETAALACAAVAEESVAVFYQTDIKVAGRWIDKAHLVLTGAERAGAHLLWHKVVCRATGRGGGRRRGARRWWCLAARGRPPCARAGGRRPAPRR
jgi:hypothetical protein